MSGVVGGTTVASAGEIQARLNGLSIPGLEEPQTSVPQPQPQPTLNPNPFTPTPVPPSSLAYASLIQTDFAAQAEESQPVVDVPVFFEEREEPQEAVEAPPEDDLEEGLPETPAAENFKKLRGVVKTERLAKRELEGKLRETSSELEKYQKGEVIPDVLRAKDLRIAELEPYEKIINLKMSPEYQENFVQPAIEKRGRLEKIGTDHEIPNEVMHELVGIDNERQLGAAISRYFDPVTGVEVKQIVRELQDIGAKAIEAEREPETHLEALKSRYLERQDQERQERARLFELVAKEGWNQALEKTKTEGAYRELILHPTDVEFNKKVVEPIQHRASLQYGTLIRKLSEYGLKTLPSDLALGLARMVQLSIGGAMLMEAKHKAETERNAVIQNTKRTNGYARPTIGGSNGSGHSTRAPAQQPLLNPKTAGEQALKVFNK